MFGNHVWENSEFHGMGELPMGSIESQRYAQGLTIIKSLFNHLTSYTTTPSQFLRKVPLTIAKLQASVRGNLTQEEWEKYIIGLAEKKNAFLKIPAKTAGDWDSILVDIANATPIDGLTTRKIIDNQFLSHPEYFQNTKMEKLYLVAKASKDVAVASTKAVTGTLDFIGNTKYFLLAGVLGVIAYKLLGQSDKVSMAYNTLKNDSKAGLGKLSEKAKAGMAHVRSMKLKKNPSKKRRKSRRK